MEWMYLIGGGIAEIIWALGLKESHGFTEWGWSAITVLFFNNQLLFICESITTGTDRHSICSLYRNRISWFRNSRNLIFK